MKENRDTRRAWWIVWPLRLLAVLVIVVGVQWMVYQPDRPLPVIAPASSSGPAFIVQILRPRLGLPLGGLLPPQFFGQDASLRIDSNSKGASIRRVASERIEVKGDNWVLQLVFDSKGQVTAKSQVVFDLIFKDRLRRVRGRPGSPVIGTLNLTTLESGELSGRFDVELPHCEDATTGTPLGWPPRPLRLYGSFDRLPKQ